MYKWTEIKLWASQIVTISSEIINWTLFTVVAPGQLPNAQLNTAGTISLWAISVLFPIRFGSGTHTSAGFCE